MDKFSISIVIPNYNGKKLLEKNLPFAIEAAKKATNDFEIIIADDFSNDDSISFIKNNYPEIKLVIGDKNVGFAGNANRGVFAASKELIFLLNTDVKLTENYFEFLLPHFKDENLFGVMGALTTENTGEIQDGAKYPKWKGAQLNFTLNYIFKENKPALSLFLSGANALVNREKIQSIGGFNELFNPFYFEDAELGLRTWRMGWKNIFEPRAICFHEVSSTIKSHHKKQKIKITARRNKMLLHDLHLEGIKRILWKTEMILNLCFRWISFKKEYYSSYSQYKKLKPFIKREKYRFSTQEVVNSILKEIGNEEIKIF